MAGESKIEWCTDTWNPVRGCVKVSPGCKHCYAEAFAERWRGVPGHAYEQGFDLRLVPEALRVPLKWSRPRLIFVNSMSDLFWEKVPTEYVDRIFAVMATAKQHVFQLLTKRATRMREYLSDPLSAHRVARAIDALEVDLEHARDPAGRWAGVPGFPGYVASSHGCLRSERAEALKTSINPRTGRETVTIWNSGQPKTVNVHWAVLAAHRPRSTEDLEVCHRNGNKLDNRLANLRWGTRAENQAEKVRHGSRGGPQKLSPADAAAIKSARASGETQQAIADRFGVSRSLVSLIESGRVWSGPDMAWPPRNVWCGVSVEDRKYGLPRIDELRAAPAAVRFLSIEPLLEDLGPIDLTGIAWVICGGESGAKARPMHPDWARSVRDQCRAQGVPFHFKQWGGTNKKAAGRELDGRTWDEWPRGFVPPPRRGLSIVATRNAGQGALPLGGDHG